MQLQVCLAKSLILQQLARPGHFVNAKSKSRNFHPQNTSLKRQKEMFRHSSDPQWTIQFVSMCKKRLQLYANCRQEIFAARADWLSSLHVLRAVPRNIVCFEARSQGSCPNSLTKELNLSSRQYYSEVPKHLIRSAWISSWPLPLYQIHESHSTRLHWELSHTTWLVFLPFFDPISHAGAA